MDLDSKKDLQKLILDLHEDNEVHKNRDMRKKVNSVNYVELNEDSDVDIFEGDEVDDCDYVPSKNELEYETDISDDETSTGKRKKRSINMQMNKRARLNEDNEGTTRLMTVNSVYQSDSNYGYSGLQMILDMLNNLRKEAAVMEYRLKSLERNSLPLASSSNSLDKISGEPENSLLFLNLPLENKLDADKFELKLGEPEFRNIVIKHIEELFGNQIPINTKQALPAVINSLFSAELLSQYTWTGKTDSKQPGNRKKFAFKAMTRILAVVLQIMQRIDGCYDIEKMNRDITYTVLKYAYKFTKLKKEECTEESS